MFQYVSKLPIPDFSEDMDLVGISYKPYIIRVLVNVTRYDKGRVA